MTSNGEVKKFRLTGTEWVDSGYCVGDVVEAQYHLGENAWMMTAGGEYYVHTPDHVAYSEWGGDPIEEYEQEMSSYDKGLLSERFDHARFDVYSTLDTYDKAIEFLRDTIADLERWRTH